MIVVKLLTKEIISKFENHPFRSQEEKGFDAEVLVKYFNPCGSGTWLITEAEREGDDWRLFGYCHIHEWEWGFLMLSELTHLHLPFGLSIERTAVIKNRSRFFRVVSDASHPLVLPVQVTFRAIFGRREATAG